jgi:hypothetical protein
MKCGEILTVWYERSVLLEATYKWCSYLDCPECPTCSIHVENENSVTQTIFPYAISQHT